MPPEDNPVVNWFVSQYFLLLRLNLDVPDLQTIRLYASTLDLPVSEAEYVRTLGLVASKQKREQAESNGDV